MPYDWRRNRRKTHPLVRDDRNYGYGNSEGLAEPRPHRMRVLRPDEDNDVDTSGRTTTEAPSSGPSLPKKRKRGGEVLRPDDNDADIYSSSAAEAGDPPPSSSRGRESIVPIAVVIVIGSVASGEAK